jgi:hypothetical protein
MTICSQIFAGIEYLEIVSDQVESKSEFVAAYCLLTFSQLI